MKRGIIVALVVVVIVGSGIGVWLTQRHAEGRAVLRELGDPATAMNEVLERANPGAHADWRAFEHAEAIVEAWQRDLMAGWLEDDPIDPSTRYELINYGAWPREEYTEGVAFVEDFRDRGGFAALAAIGESPVLIYRWPAGADIDAAFTARLQSGGRARGLIRAGRAELRLAASEGRIDDFLAVADGMLAVGELKAAQLLAIDLIVAVSIQQTTLTEICHLVREHRLDADVLADISTMIERRAIRPDWQATLDMERVYSLATSPVPGLAAQVDAFYSGDAQAVIEEAPLVRDDEAYLQTLMASISGDLTDEGLMASMAQAMQMLATTMKQFDLMLDGMRTVVAIERYRAVHGELPGSLEALTPEFLAGTPDDPLGNGPLVYRVDGDSYVLYSVGADGVDDGGALNMVRGFGVAGLDSSKTGIDHVFTTPRQPISDALDWMDGD